MATNDDISRDVARTRVAAERTLLVQAIQTGILVGASVSMAAALDAIHREIADVRETAKEGLAVEAELLNRDKLQALLEELTYQMEKLVAETEALFQHKEKYKSLVAESRTSDAAADERARFDVGPLLEWVRTGTQRYFDLRSLQERIKNDRIHSAMIRGRENKAAFDNAATKAERLCEMLQEDSAVKEAIATKQSEKTRLEKELRSQAANAPLLAWEGPQNDIVFPMQSEEERLRTVDRRNPTCPLSRLNEDEDEEVVDRLARIAFEALGHESEIEPGKSDHVFQGLRRIVVTGASGSRRTRLAESFAETLELPFLKTNAKDLASADDLLERIAYFLSVDTWIDGQSLKLRVFTEHPEARPLRQRQREALMPGSGRSLWRRFYDAWNLPVEDHPAAQKLIVLPPMVVCVKGASTLKPRLADSLLKATNPVAPVMVTESGFKVLTGRVLWFFSTSHFRLGPLLNLAGNEVFDLW